MSEHQSGSNQDRLGLCGFVILMLYGGTLLGLSLNSSRGLTGHEVLRSEPAREMLETGDWVIPHFGQVPAMQKPPMINWVIGSSMAIFKSRQPWVCRLPIVIATLLNAWLIALLATRWHGRRVGLAAGMIFVSSFIVMLQSRLAELDMLLTLMVTGAFAAFALAHADDTPDKPKPPYLALVALFGLFTGMSIVAKFLIGPLFLLSGSLLYVIVTRKWKVLGFVFHPLSIACMLAVALPWYYLVYQRLGNDALEKWGIENFGRINSMGGTWGKGKNFFFYFYTVPWILMPWTPWLISAVFAGRRRGMWKHDSWKLIACFFSAGFIALSIGSWKHKHYILPVLPGLSILTAWYLVTNTYDRIDRRQRQSVAVILIVLVSAGAVFAVSRMLPQLTLTASIGIAIVAGLLIASSIMDYKARPRATLVCLFATFWFAGVYAHAFVEKHFDGYQYSAALGQRASQVIPEGKTTYFVGIGENHIAFYLTWPVQRVDDIHQFPEIVRSGGAGEYFLVTSQAHMEVIDALGQVEVLDQQGQLRQRQKEHKRLIFVKLIPGVN